MALTRISAKGKLTGQKGLELISSLFQLLVLSDLLCMIRAVDCQAGGDPI